MSTTILVGGLCSGKTTFAKMLELVGYNRVLTHTTRRPRPGEVNGVDYHFHTEATFHALHANGRFAETMTRNTVDGPTLYGSPVVDLKSEEDNVMILTPEGAARYHGFAHIIWLDIPKWTRVSRALKRGDDPSAIRVLMDAEDIMFKKFEESEKFDVRVTSGMSHFMHRS